MANTKTKTPKKQTQEEKNQNTAFAKYGARVYQYGDTVMVKQTVRRGVPPEYVIDRQREIQLKVGNDAGIGIAVQDALKGAL